MLKGRVPVKYVVSANFKTIMPFVALDPTAIKCPTGCWAFFLHGPLRGFGCLASFLPAADCTCIRGFRFLQGCAASTFTLSHGVATDFVIFADVVGDVHFSQYPPDDESLSLNSVVVLLYHLPHQIEQGRKFTFGFAKEAILSECLQQLSRIPLECCKLCVSIQAPPYERLNIRYQSLPANLFL
jgi:hypothetical protein